MAAVVALHMHGRKLIGIATFDLRNFQQVTPSGRRSALAVRDVPGLHSRRRSPACFGGGSRLPPAEACFPVSVVLAAVFLKMGTYGFVQADGCRSSRMPHARLRPCWSPLPALGILFGAVAALAQPNWTRVLAYATLSHICLVLLGTFALTPDGLTGSIVHQVSHGVSIAALLFLAGGRRRRAGRGHALAESRLTLTTMPVVAALWLLSTLSLVAVPKLSGFVGTRLVVEGSWSVHPSVVRCRNGRPRAFSAIALLWLFARTMLGELRSPAGDALKDLRLPRSDRDRAAGGASSSGWGSGPRRSSPPSRRRSRASCCGSARSSRRKYRIACRSTATARADRVCPPGWSWRRRAPRAAARRNRSQDQKR